jgi:activator of HSP90 ATPase
MSVQQQAMIPAGPREVYAILADAGALCALSGMGGTAGRAEGAEFSAFDGAICGRQVELVPGARMVQAWRFSRWAPGIYTIVRFTLEAIPGHGPGGPADSGTLLRVEQCGYPEEADADGCHETWHDHLNSGWVQFYLTPLARHFESQAASARAAAEAEIKSLAQAAHAGGTPHDA